MPKVSGIPKVKFNLEPEPDGPEAYIHLIFRYRSKRLKRATGEKVNPKYWDTKAQRATLDKRTPNRHVLINSTLDSFASTVIQIYRDFNLGDVSLEKFRLEIDYRMGFKARPESEQAGALPLLEFIPVFIEEKKSQPRGTWKILQTVFNLLQQYAQERAPGLDYSRIDYQFFSDFKTWLHQAPRQHSTNYASKVVDVLKQFMREAQRRGYHSKTDYQGFSIKKAKTTKIALSFEELEHLYSLDLSGNTRLEKVRDLFLIGSYTGLRFSDFTRIQPEHIETIAGKTILTITTQKTGETVSIPLLDIPAALLRKYNYLTPKISNQKMNAYLKELGQLAGMTGKMIVTNTTGGKRNEEILEKWQKLTTHVARRSFATNFYRAGVPAVVLMKITGHATERQFMQYIAIDGKMNALHFAEIQKEGPHLSKVAG